MAVKLAYLSGYIFKLISMYGSFTQFLSIFFRNQGGEMLYARYVELAKDVAYPLKPNSSQVTRSHSGKAKNYEPNTGLHQFPPPFQQKRKNDDMRNRNELKLN